MGSNQKPFVSSWRGKTSAYGAGNLSVPKGQLMANDKPQLGAQRRRIRAG
jgi:hypothetical protein